MKSKTKHTMKYALTAKHSLLFCDLILCAVAGTKYFKKSLDINYKISESLIRDHAVFWNYNNDSNYNDALLKNKTLNEAVNHYISSLISATSHLETTAQEISDSGKMCHENKRILAKLFTKYYHAYLLNMPFLYSYWNTEHLIITQLQTDFQAIYGSKSEAILRQLLIPAHPTYFEKEKKHMKKITTYISGNNNLKSKIIANKPITDPYCKFLIYEHLAHFAFTSTAFYLGKPLDEKAIIERLKTALEDSIVNEKTANTREKQLQKLDAYQEVKERLLIACEFLYWKNQRLDILFKSDFLINPLLQTIASLMGLSFLQLVYMRYSEINAWFRTGNLPYKKDLNNRIQSYTMYLKDGKITVLTDRKKYPKLANEQKTLISHAQKQFTGTVAYRGEITGRVRLVFFSEDNIRVKKGEILVTTMTRPDMILGMEKAAAFITDHGGMLSHAAIIAREMRKPCIVGTHFATQVLKDGDLVEVDAVKGLVKLLK